MPEIVDDSTDQVAAVAKTEAARSLTCSCVDSGSKTEAQATADPDSGHDREIILL